MTGKKAPSESYFSWSQLQTYESCPEKYRLRYIEHIPAEASGALIAGKAGHKVIELAELDAIWAETDAAEQLRALFIDEFAFAVAEAGGPESVRWTGQPKLLRDEQGKEILDKDGNKIKVKENDLWWEHEGPRMLRRYIAARKRLHEQGYSTRLTDKGRVDGIELEVTARIAGRLVKGYIDAVLLEGSEGDAIHDWKFGKYDDPYQLAVYSVLLEQGRDIVVRRGSMGRLRENDPTKVLASFDLEPWIELVEPDFVALAHGIEAGVFPKKRSNFCVSCSVREACSWGRTLEVAA